MRKAKGAKSLFGSFGYCTRNSIARPLHIEYPDIRHHVMNKSRRKENIFVDLNVHDMGFVTP